MDSQRHHGSRGRVSDLASRTLTSAARRRLLGALVGGAFAVTQVFAGAFGAASATPLLNATEVVHLLHESCSASTAPAAAPTAQVVAQTVPSAAPPPTPTPFATPGIPRVITGPGTLVPPTAPPSGPVVTPPPLPTPTPTPVASNGPVLLVRPTPGPTGSGAPGPSPANIPTAGPVPLPTLGPNQFAVLGDELSGSTKEGLPTDYKGNVHIFYSEGTIVGDLAHYDGDHTVTVTGHAYIINHNADSILCRQDRLRQQDRQRDPDQRARRDEGGRREGRTAL
jgi:hypothetical protein